MNRVTDSHLDREEAKKEDTFDFGADYEEEEDEEWEQEADWNNEADEAEDVKDESAAYLEFLNEEVRALISIALLITDVIRPKNFLLSMTMTTMSWKRRASSRHPSTRLSPMACSSMRCSVCLPFSMIECMTNISKVSNKNSPRYTIILQRT